MSLNPSSRTHHQQQLPSYRELCTTELSIFTELLARRSLNWLSDEARKAKKEAWDHKTRLTGKTKESSRNYECIFIAHLPHKNNCGFPTDIFSCHRMSSSSDDWLLKIWHIAAPLGLAYLVLYF
ncbi:Uncharacterized protein HZ326_27213 [Fusarium oxysporum f. sp. albedinis]|nr:Uncharacterized protein HZ326_27213 [Fusarium oxysporum f. sp. albedinis]